jgi:hypothetical protein
MLAHPRAISIIGETDVGNPELSRQRPQKMILAKLRAAERRPALTWGKEQYAPDFHEIMSYPRTRERRKAEQRAFTACLCADQERVG